MLAVLATAAVGCRPISQFRAPPMRSVRAALRRAVILSIAEVDQLALGESSPLLARMGGL
eukprot:12069683-Karenia_brevis.AAC.1